MSGTVIVKGLMEKSQHIINLILNYNEEKAKSKVDDKKLENIEAQIQALNAEIQIILKKEENTPFKLDTQQLYTIIFALSASNKSVKPHYLFHHITNVPKLNKDDSVDTDVLENIKALENFSNDGLTPTEIEAKDALVKAYEAFVVLLISDPSVNENITPIKELDHTEFVKLRDKRLFLFFECIKNDFSLYEQLFAHFKASSKTVVKPQTDVTTTETKTPLVLLVDMTKVIINSFIKYPIETFNYMLQQNRQIAELKERLGESNVKPLDLIKLINLIDWLQVPPLDKLAKSERTMFLFLAQDNFRSEVRGGDIEHPIATQNEHLCEYIVKNGVPFSVDNGYLEMARNFVEICDKADVKKLKDNTIRDERATATRGQIFTRDLDTEEQSLADCLISFEKCLLHSNDIIQMLNDYTANSTLSFDKSSAMQNFDIKVSVSEEAIKYWKAFKATLELELNKAKMKVNVDPISVKNCTKNVVLCDLVINFFENKAKYDQVEKPSLDLARDLGLNRLT